MPVRLKRVYDDPAPDDGHRVLVDRLWPRGVSKEAAHLDEWLQDAAPSSELRRWLGHDPDRWDEFRERYRSELRDREKAGEPLDRLASIVRDGGTVTLLYAGRDPDHTHAIVLRDVVSGKAAH